MTLTLLAMMMAAQAAVATPAPPVPAPPPARVEIVLYSDFQCPFCAQFAQSYRELQARGVDGVQTTIRFRHFPLSIHPAAQLAHQAAAAAMAQGKFWEMHNLLFANQRRVQRADLLDYARKLGLDIGRFEKDLDSDSIKQAIAADLAEGNKVGVDGTPTYTINGKVYSGTKPFAQLEQLIGGEQRRARALAEITDSAMSKGPEGAPVLLEVFVDLQSPVSPLAMAVVNNAMQRRPAAVRLQFRNFPLSFHPQAALAHEAAMTAARQGRFWEFATYVLEHQDALREQDLIALAGRVGLDASMFADTIRNHRYAPRVEADVQAGFDKGIRGSPVIFVNGRRIDGVPSLQTLNEYIDAALASQPLNPRQ